MDPLEYEFTWSRKIVLLSDPTESWHLLNTWILQQTLLTTLYKINHLPLISSAQIIVARTEKISVSHVLCYIDSETKRNKTQMFISGHLKLIPNNTFWEELIADFPWDDIDHTENDASNNSSIVACIFVTAVTFPPSRCLQTIGGFLPNRCLATIGGIHRHTHRQQHDLISLLYFIKVRKVY
jgi:hypothetical protein